MLSVLHIENIAVIERADIEFRPGLNVLTGETGAGKSIIVDAISAIIGERTSRDILRTGAESALVGATFCALPELKWFEDNDIHPDDGGNINLQRKMTGDGRNTCRVNGCPVSLSQLRELGSQLLSIHGQHDSLQLLDEGYHLSYVDNFSENQSLKNEFINKFNELRDIDKKIEQLSMGEAEKARKSEMLEFQINELETACLTPGEDIRLKERQMVLRNFGKIADAVESANVSLNGNENISGALSLAYDASNSLSNVADLGGNFAEVLSRIDEAKFILEDAAREISSLTDELEFSPQEQDEVESRLDILHRLGKKYGHDVEDMLTFLDNAKQELSVIEQGDEEIERLKALKVKVESETLLKAAALTENRKKNAAVLKNLILAELSDLDMGKLMLEIEITPAEMDETGADRVRILMSSNAGEALKPINKIASGGELSRIILAMKNVLAEKEPITTMVFDEVDTGVSGRAAAKVAKKLAQVSLSKQVFCVTHLPQIAAMAETHFSVEKAERDGRTYTSVTALNSDCRKHEIARIIGGENITDAQIESAAEMIASCDEFRASLYS